MRKFTYLQLISAVMALVFFSAEVLFAGNLTFTAPPSAGEYVTGDGLITAQTDCRIEPGNNVTFNGALGVTLKPGFHAKAGSNFTAKMPDWDGLSNQWELNNFGNLNHNPGEDPDHDNLTNAQEISLGTDPNSCNYYTPFLHEQLQTLTSGGTAAVGVVPGKFEVTQTGAASYRIPISIPPGTAAIEPGLSLSYNSQLGNGLLGMGWALSGLMAISRCPKPNDTVHFDTNFVYEAKDDFSLDGQHLRAMSGAYGWDGTEYHTAIESFTKIVSYGTAGNGPAYFKAWTKTGLILTFGGTSDSRIEAQGRDTARVWALSRMEDRSGNYLTVSYQEDNANGDYRPVRIDYTGNDSLGLTPSRSVRFEYESRPDVSPVYLGGTLIQVMARLTHVKTYVSETLVHDYQLAYEQGLASGRSRLVRVIESDGAGNSLPPTSFLWQDGGANFVQGQPHDLCGCTSKRLGDFNGDGKTDILEPINGTFYVNYATDNWTSTWVPAVSGTVDQYEIADFNGDGKADILKVDIDPRTASYAWYISLATENGFQDFVQWGADLISNGEQTRPVFRIGDFNGDGRADIIQIDDNGNSYVWTSQGTHFHKAHWSTQHDTLYLLTFLGDFNGDGKTDLLHLHRESSGVWNFYVRRSLGGGFAEPENWGTGYNPEYWNIPGIKIGDFNGDGKNDIVQTHWPLWLWFSTGTGFTSRIDCGYGHGNSDQLGDFNGDGKTDIIQYTNDGKSLVRFATATGFSDPVEWGPGGSQYLVGDFNGDGKSDILKFDGSSCAIWETRSGISDLLTGIMTGTTASTTITYEPITNNGIYAKGSDAAYPDIMDVQGPLYVVSSFGSSDGVGGECAISYSYGEAQVSRTLGFLGFGWIEEIDEETGIETTSYYSQYWPCVGLISRKEKKLPNGVLIYKLDNTLVWRSIPYKYVSFPYICQSTEQNYELTGQLITESTTTTQYDDWGNPTSVNVSSLDGLTKSVVNTYDNNPDTWIIGRLSREEVTCGVPGQAQQKRTRAFVHNLTNGLVTREEIEPGTNLSLVTDYEYDSYGNQKTIRVSGPNIETRTTTTEYDTYGRFPWRITNAEGQVETRSYDQRFGLMASQTDPNSATTSWAYDGFANKTIESRPDGSQTSWTRAWCLSGAPSLGCYSTTGTTTSGGISYGPPVTTYYDMFGREIRMQTVGSGGKTVFRDTEYNHLLRVERRCANYFSGETPVWTNYTYDVVGRTLTETAPATGQTTVAHNGLVTTLTNALGQARTEVRDSTGQMKEVRDAYNKSTYYTYDPFGNLIQVTDPLGNISQMTYDIRGRKIAMNDPDMGFWSYSYDSVGNLISETDAKGQTISLIYDKLNRLKKKDYPTGTDTEFLYDETWSSYGKGRVTTVTDSSGTEKFYYDIMGRTIRTVKTVDGNSYSIQSEYDPLGRTKNITYPDGETINYSYDEGGNLKTVSGYATISDRTALGQVKNIAYANNVNTVQQYYPSTNQLYSITTNSPTQGLQNVSYSYDQALNVQSITDYIDNSRSQSFIYDNLNRLKEAHSGAYQTITYSYNEIGNITYNSQLGSYTYGSRPHAVVQAGPNSYSYDLNGNMTNRAGKNITYDYDNRPVSMEYGSNTATYVYDHSGQRIKKSTPSTTMIYIGKLCEYKNGVLTKYVFAGETRIASKTTGATYFYHADHLGSSTVITDTAGSKVEETYYYPFGKVRSDSGSAHVNYKYTGQEEDDETGLYYLVPDITIPPLAGL